MADYTTLSLRDFDNPARTNAGFSGTYGCTTVIDSGDSHSGTSSLLVTVTDTFAGFSEFYNGFEFGADVRGVEFARVSLYYKPAAPTTTTDVWVFHLFWEKEDGAGWFERMGDSLSLSIPLPAVPDWTLIDTGIIRVPDGAALLAREYRGEGAGLFSWRMDDEHVQAVHTSDLSRFGIDATAQPRHIYGTATRRK